MNYISSISEKLGEVNANYLNKQSPQLRENNQIKTIHSSLQIEGNTLSEEQITALVEKKRVIGPKKDITEVLNALKVYENLANYHFISEKHFLEAHGILMHSIIENPGLYRKKGVGIVKGSKVEHVAPPYENVPHLMKDLFDYLKDPNELSLIKSCVFHYELEFIHPFTDGNGRMGRLLQTLILKEKYPIFDFIPLEALIRDTQSDYYQALSLSDKSGKSTLFIEYMLGVIDRSLAQLLNYTNRILKDTDRLDYFLTLNINEFNRKKYMGVLKNISSATASRDLKLGVELGIFEKEGDKTKTIYRIKK